jgi:ArsR family transcriptional regulator, arsenate/arsenite/antimonite-responsive transcriptional repressor
VSAVTAATCTTPLTAPALDTASAEALAGLFGALADPARIKLIHRMASVAPEGVCVCDLIEPLGLAQSAVSYHLKLLLQSGLVERERRGQFNYYALRADALARLAMLVGPAGTA